MISAVMYIIAYHTLSHYSATRKRAVARLDGMDGVLFSGIDCQTRQSMSDHDDTSI